MALKALMLRKQINDKQKMLDELRSKDAEFVTREAALEQSIEEAATDEEREVVSAAIEQFEGEKTAHEENKANLEKEIGDLENELGELEKEPAAPVEKPVETKTEERKEVKIMDTRKKFFGMSVTERDAFFAREDVKEFLQRARELGKQKRTVNGADLLIPTVVLDLIRENIEGYSKLYKHVNVRRVPGEARQVIMGTVPEAIWTEMCSTLNELNLDFSHVEVDGFKVGGYIAVCNSILEDSDIALASEIFTALGQAIGIAIDKAIIYGTNTKMPYGILPALAASASENIVALTAKTDAALFKAIVEESGKAKSAYSRGAKFWAMNEATYTKLVANAMSINAAGAIASGLNNTMPVIGGAIEVLNFIPDDVIVGGYGDLYLLAERAGMYIGQSEHVRYIEDQTVFKATARYDGEPVIPAAFVAIGISGTKPSSTAVTFAEDKANAAG